MSETIIKDGTGVLGYSAKVDEENRLHVLANMVPHPQHHAMYHQNLFMIGMCCTLQATDVEEVVGIFQNIDTEVEFEFYITTISVNTDVDIMPRFNDLYNTGGEVVIPRNMNVGSGLTIPDTRAKIFDGEDLGTLTVDTTNGFYWGPTIFAKARQCTNIDFQGGLIIGNGKSISFNATGPVDSEICILGMCSYHDAGTKL